MYPNIINKLINDFRKLPGVGEKTAERYALHILDLDEEDIEDFSIDLKDIKKNIKECQVCHNLSESDKCYICEDNSRDSSTVCVVEEFKDVVALERTGSYKGLYHVLGGLISPLDGRLPEDININSLVKRIKGDGIKEIILALKPSVEGETTAQYILKILDGTGVDISRIANGLPIGADIEYVDALTLERALEDRRKISS